MFSYSASLNLPTRFFSPSDCAESSWLVAEVSSAAAELLCTTPKTIRGRLLVYLSNQAAKAGSNHFKIPFDRQGLADYLNVDRSALSKELGKMRDEGILTTRKNAFTLY